MRHLAAPALLLALAAVARAEITFEGETKVPLYGVAKVRAKSPDYKSFIYRVYNTKGERIKTEEGKHGHVLFGGAPGTYRVEALAGKLDKDGGLMLDEAITTVTIGGDPGPTPPPDPVPPPDPPTPPPDPLSPLAKLLKPALASETASDKKTLAAALAVVYAEGAVQVRKGAPKTMGQLWKQMVAGSEAAKVSGKIPIVQGVVANHLSKKLPSKSSETITDDNRESVASALSEVSAALKEVAK